MFFPQDILRATKQSFRGFFIHFPHKLVTEPAYLLQDILVSFKFYLKLLMVTGLWEM